MRGRRGGNGMMYNEEGLVKVEPPDPEAWRPVDLPGGDLPAMVKWAMSDAEVEAAGRGSR